MATRKLIYASPTEVLKSSFWRVHQVEPQTPLLISTCNLTVSCSKSSSAATTFEQMKLTCWLGMACYMILTHGSLALHSWGCSQMLGVGRGKEMWKSWDKHLLSWTELNPPIPNAGASGKTVGKKTVATNLVMTFSIKRLLSCLWREEMFLKWHGHDVESHNMLSVSSTAAPSISSIGALYRMNMKISRAKTSHSSDCEQGSQWTIQTKWKH